MRNRSIGRLATLTAAGALLGALVAACSTTESTSPVSALSARTTSWDGSELPGYVRACKQSGPAGSYTFAVSVQGGGDFYYPWGQQVTLTFDGVTPVCQNLYIPIINATWDPTETANVTVTELVPAGMVVNQIDIYEISVNFPGFLSTITGTNSVTVTTSPTQRYKLLFYNGELPPPPPPPPPPPGGGQGCTPGYWKVKQHLDSWAGTGFSPGQLINTVFTVPAGLTLNGVNLGAYTMRQGLSFQGGSTPSGKAEILLRAAIAAVLNSGGVNYGMTTAQVVNAVNDALASDDNITMVNLARILDGLNNQGCPLN
jgi:hypothetical protein